MERQSLQDKIQLILSMNDTETTESIESPDDHIHNLESTSPAESINSPLSGFISTSFSQGNLQREHSIGSIASIHSDSRNMADAVMEYAKNHHDFHDGKILNDTLAHEHHHGRSRSSSSRASSPSSNVALDILEIESRRLIGSSVDSTPSSSPFSQKSENDSGGDQEAIDNLPIQVNDEGIQYTSKNTFDRQEEFLLDTQPTVLSETNNLDDDRKVSQESKPAPKISTAAKTRTSTFTQYESDTKEELLPSQPVSFGFTTKPQAPQDADRTDDLRQEGPTSPRVLSVTSASTVGFRSTTAPSKMPVVSSDTSFEDIHGKLSEMETLIQAMASTRQISIPPKDVSRNTSDIRTTYLCEEEQAKQNLQERAGNRLYESAVRQREKLEKKRHDEYHKQQMPTLVSSEKLRQKTVRHDKKRYDSLYEEGQRRRKSLGEKIAKQEAQPDGCTFSPSRVTAAGRNDATPQDAVARGNLLYAKAQELQKKMKERKERSEQRERQMCSFSPQITSKARNLTRGSPEDRIKELHSQREDRITQLYEMKEKREMKGCTFTPEILRTHTNGQMEFDGVPVHERLISRHRDTLDHVEELRKQKLEDEDKELTFTPNKHKTKVNTPGEDSEDFSPPPPPVHERLFQESIEKARSRDGSDTKTVRSTRSDDSDLELFMPPVFERLTDTRPQEIKMMVEEELRIAELAEELDECTFRPNLHHHEEDHACMIPPPPIWQRLASTPLQSHEEPKNIMPTTRSPSNTTSPSHRPGIWDRLNAEGYLKQQKMEIADNQKILYELEECSFSPAVGPRLYEDTDHSPVWDRLNESPTVRRKELERKKEEHDLRECSFSPAINATYADKEPKSKVWEQLKNSKQDRIEELEKKKEQLELRDCTFKPKLLPVSAKRKSKQKDSKTRMEELARPRTDYSKLYN